MLELESTLEVKWSETYFMGKETWTEKYSDLHNFTKLVRDGHNVT